MVQFEILGTLGFGPAFAQQNTLKQTAASFGQ
jgi:hypothetical protein